VPPPSHASPSRQAAVAAGANSVTVFRSTPSVSRPVEDHPLMLPEQCYAVMSDRVA
jgi:hypothetical protein